MGRYLCISLKNMKRTVNSCGAQSMDFVGNHEERSESVWGKEQTEYSESVWGAICEFP